MNLESVEKLALSLKDSELSDLMVESFKHTKIFAQQFLGERFYAPFSVLHDEIFDLIDSGEPYVAIAAPRGIGKTSIVGLALTAKRIMFNDSRFIMYISMSFDSSCLQTENLKRELTSNIYIKELFGPIKFRGGEGIDESFSKKSWVARGHTLVYPRGSGQQVRGVLFKNARPDLFVIDDLEDPETIANDDIRRKRKEWFNADVLKACSRVDKNYQFVYIDTLKHEDALLEDLLGSDRWVSVRQEICNDELISNAPEFISDAEILEEHEYHKEQGILDVFYREFRNIPISTEDAVFKAEYFKYFQDAGPDIHVYEPGATEPEKVRTSNLLTMVLCDPAKTVKMQSADSAVGVVSVDRQTKRVFFRHYESGKVYPDELYEWMFSSCLMYNAMFLGVEVTSLHEFISQPIQNEMRVRGIHPMYIELNARGKKEERVAHMAPYYRQGYVYHNRNKYQKLEGQLLGFPRSKLWDVMDMFAYFVLMLDKLAHYFDPEDLDDDPRVMEAEYRELEDEGTMEYQRWV